MTDVSLPPVPVDSMLYYYGNISRETAEWILWDRGCEDGMYLLRESNTDYVLSLCYQKSVLHYRIKKLQSGEVGLCGVPRQKFAGPVELVEGVEGLACKPTVPCNKSLDSVLPSTHWGVTEEEIRKAILKKAKEWGIDEDKLDSSLTENCNDIKLLITKTLHEIQPWFHGPLSRVEAEKRIEDSGHKDGRFLVRERDGSSYALCLSHSGRIKHYKIDVLPSGEFAIQDGQRFPSIMALVSHYTLFSDGLWCSLQDPCAIPSRSTSGSRTHDRSTEPRTRTSTHHSTSVTLDRSKTLGGGRQSPSSNSQSRTSRFLSNINQKGLLSKLVATVAPQIASQTLPQNVSHSRTTSARHRAHLYPSLSDDNLEGGDLSRSVRARTSPVSVNTNPSTPSSSRKSSLSNRDDNFPDAKKGKIHKASSFDILPAFLSMLLYSENATDTEKKVKKKNAGNCHKNTQTEGNPSNHRNSSPHCNGFTNENAAEVHNNDASSKAHKLTPIPAPRLSLAKKLCKVSGPVYANREVLASSGRSISLGESASDPIPEEAEPLRIVQNGLHIPQPFIRSASSPSVVSHSKAKPHPPPRLPHSSTSEMKGSESLPSSPLTPTLIRENKRVLSLNGQLNVHSQDHPVPKPRRASQPSRPRYETSCNSCASTDSSTSPTLTEMSEELKALIRNTDPVFRSVKQLGPDSLSEEMVCGELELDSQDVNQETTTETERPVSVSNSEAIEQNYSVSLQTHRVSTPETSRTSRATSPFAEPLNSASTQPELSMIKDISSIKSNGHVIDPMENSTYATLSGSSDVICSLNSDMSIPLSSTPSTMLENNDVFSSKDINCIYSISREESELAYLTLRQCRRGPINLDYKSIALKEKIGSGNFGEVHKGVYSTGPMEVQFAIKALKSNSVPNPKSEILKEAQTMAALDHPHIVRLIGVCEGESFMLVMELAPLGPLNKYLKIHREMSVSSIMTLMLQVASAMEYLEGKQYVHRDLAARNLLLVNENFVKISDFGMSRALGLGKEYYRAEVAGKWPLKWYAPECIYYFKFSSKSDVWSFGITLWETFSFGEKPYQGMSGQDILRMFDKNKRLARPEHCPPVVYNVMWKCWQYKKGEESSVAETTGLRDV